MPIVIAVKSIIDWVENGSIVKQERVLWIDHDESKAVVFDIRDSRAQPRWCNLEDIYSAIQAGRAVKHPCDPFAKICTNDKHKDKGKERWQIIKGIVTCEPDVYFHNLKAAMVQDCINKFKIKKTAVYAYIRLYWVYGKTEAALSLDYANCGNPGKDKPDTVIKRGRPVGAKTGKRKSVSDSEAKVASGINITDEIRGVIQATIDLFYYPNKNIKPFKLFQKMNETFFRVGTYWKDGVEVPKLLPRDQRPTKEQFYYWFKKLVDPVKAKKQQEGDLAFKIKYREHKGNATQLAIGPGYLYAVDWTMADIYLVNKVTRTKVMQRPIVYICVDVFSHFITSVTVTLERSSWMTGAMVVENLVEDRIEEYRRYNVTELPEDYPNNKLLPAGFLADRGEFYCKNSDAITKILGPQVLNTSPYRADCKSIVEQLFRRFNLKVIHLLPGMVPKEPVRWEPDHRLNAKLDIDQFTRLLFGAAKYYNLYHEIENYPFNQFMLATQCSAIPIDLWNWGIKHRGGHFLDVDPMVVKKALYPKATASISRRGVEFRGKLKYNCQDEKVLKKIESASIVGKETVNVMFDPRTTKYLWILDDRNPFDNPVLCTLDEDSAYSGISFEDFETLGEERDSASRARKDPQEQALAELDATEDAVVNEATKMTDTALASEGLKRPSINGMKGNTATEIERIQRERVEHGIKDSQVVTEREKDEDNMPERLEDRCLRLLKGGKYSG
ncbi:MAG: hypothetical protein RIN56_13085 [Sporomusaceae bacterium]|nr:hypothetical protein [Sporomusaceae bacterium]